MQEVRIKIPRAKDNEIVNIPKGNLGELKGHFDRQFQKIDKLLFAIVTSVVVSVAGVLIAVIGVFMDQMRYNNAVYKEYANKVESVSETQKINHDLLDQNQKNQQLILEQQQRILDLLKK